MKDKVYKTVRIRHNVLIEKELFGRIEEEADRNMRSISAQIAYFCAKGLDGESRREVLPGTPRQGTVKR